jgi:hypothetical protein
MKYHQIIVLCLAALSQVCQLQAAASLKPNGIYASSPGGGSLTLSYPQLLSASRKPVAKMIEAIPSGNETVLKYDNGTTANVTLSGDKVSIRFTALPPTVKNFKMESRLGFPLLGMNWKADGKAYAPFPEEKPAAPHLFQGGTKTFGFQYPTGGQLDITLPNAVYVQLTDTREWGWNNFNLTLSVTVLSSGPYDFTFKSTAAAASATGAAPKAKVLMDKFGQYTLKDWPGKVKSEQELKADVEAEKTYYASFNPPQFDRYGGLPGSKEKLGLQQTGFFHVEKKNGRWYLVNPDGNWFYHLGVCSFAPYSNSTYVKGRESVFEWLPPYDSEFKTAYGQNGGGTKDGQFNFHIANRIRKYGEPYDAHKFTADMIMRVRKFGFNSTGAFGSGTSEERNEVNFPYVSAVSLGGIPKLMREVWDPFDEKSRERFDKNAQSLASAANDPLLIGRFLANEPLFEDLGKAVPGYNDTKACKRRLVQMLEEKYSTVEAFNQAWGTQLASFDEARKQGLPVKTKAASADVSAFIDLFLEEYFKFSAETVKKYDPNHMLLGCRFQSGTINNESLCRIGAKYMDVWSYNYYTYGLDESFLDRIQKATGGKPMIFSEFYWNTFAESGVSGGVKDVSSQQERGIAYRHYVEHAATLPYVIGVEWYTLTDTAQTGVGFGGINGFNANSGLFGVTDRPWKNMITEMVKTNYEIYKVASGERARFVYDDPRFNRKGKVKAAMIAEYVPKPLVIDGEGGDWPGVPAERAGSGNLATGSSAGKFEAAFKVSWDNTYLYLLADVADETPMKNELSDKNLWNGDTIELFVGSEDLGKGGPLIFTDRHVFLSSVQGAPGAIHFVRGQSDEGSKAAVLPKADGSGYILEAAIPWTSLAFKPVANIELLFNVGFDDSADGKYRQRQLMWSGDSKSSGDRTNWGKLRLNGQ